MFANRRFGRFAGPVLLAAGLVAGTLTSVAGCGGSSPTAAQATASAAPLPTASRPGSAVTKAMLQKVLGCMNSHGVPISGTAAKGVRKRIKDALKALPVAKQESLLAACGQFLPAIIRQAVQQRIAQETARPTASP
jgi:hypothetical protein